MRLRNYRGSTGVNWRLPSCSQMSVNTNGKVMDLFNIENIFIHDDGSLPCITINNLSKSQVIKIYAWLRKSSSKLSSNATYWNNEKKQDTSIAIETNAAELVVNGDADSFSHSIDKLEINDIKIEDLGVFVYPESLELFYRQGSHWNKEQIDGVISALKKIISFAPNAIITACEENGTPLELKYQHTLTKLLEEDSTG